MTPSVTCTSVQQAKNCTSLPGIQPSVPCATRPMAGTAITARSKPNVQLASKDAASAAVWMRTRWNGCVTISKPNPTKKPCASGRSGSNPCLRKARTGMACAVFVCGGSGASTVRHSCEQRDKISSGSCKNRDGDGVQVPQRPCVASFWLFLGGWLVFFRSIGLFHHR